MLAFSSYNGACLAHIPQSDARSKAAVVTGGTANAYKICRIDLDPGLSCHPSYVSCIGEKIAACDDN